MSSLDRKVPATAVALEVLNGRALYHAVWQSCLGVDGALLAVNIAFEDSGYLRAVYVPLGGEETAEVPGGFNVRAGIDEPVVVEVIRYHLVVLTCIACESRGGVRGRIAHERALAAVRAKQMRTQFFLQVGKLRVARYRSQEYVVEFVGHVGFQTVADERVDGVLNGKLLHQLVFLLCRFGQRGFGEMLRVVLVLHFLQRAEILRKLSDKPIYV